MTTCCVIQIAIHEAGGIDLILLASKNHMVNADVQYSVAIVIQNMSVNESNKVSS